MRTPYFILATAKTVETSRFTQQLQCHFQATPASGLKPQEYPSASATSGLFLDYLEGDKSSSLRQQLQLEEAMAKEQREVIFQPCD